MPLHIGAPGSSVSKGWDQQWIFPRAGDYFIKDTCNLNIWTRTACTWRVGSCVVPSRPCVVSRRPVLQRRNLCGGGEHREPTNLIPVRLIPTCLQRSSDYQRGEALVADTAGLSASEYCSQGKPDLNTLRNPRRWFLCVSLPVRMWSWFSGGWLLPK